MSLCAAPGTSPRRSRIVEASGAEVDGERSEVLAGSSYSLQQLFRGWHMRAPRVAELLHGRDADQLIHLEGIHSRAGTSGERSAAAVDASPESGHPSNHPPAAPSALQDAAQEAGRGTAGIARRKKQPELATRSCPPSPSLRAMVSASSTPSPAQTRATDPLTAPRRDDPAGRCRRVASL